MKKHILIIDDDEDELKILSGALHSLKIPHKCTWAKSGEQALQQLQYLTPDIILLDVNMPYMNGLQCLEGIKKISRCSQIPVVLQSTQLNKKIIDQGLQAGAHACISKAGSFDELQTILSELLEEKYLLHHK